MVLKINIHRYTDKYKTVLSLKKKKTIKTKQTNERSYNFIYVIFIDYYVLLICFCNGQLQMFLITVYVWNLGPKKMYKNDALGRTISCFL